MVVFHCVLLAAVAGLSLGQGIRRTGRHSTSLLENEESPGSRMPKHDVFLKSERGLLDFFRSHSEATTEPSPTEVLHESTVSPPKADCPSLNTSWIMNGIENLKVQINDLKKDVRGIDDIRKQVVSIGSKVDSYKNNTNGIIEKNYNKIDHLIVKDITKVENKLEEIYQSVAQSGGNSEGACPPDAIAAIKSDISRMMTAVARMEQNQIVGVTNVGLIMKMVEGNSKALKTITGSLVFTGHRPPGSSQSSYGGVLGENRRFAASHYQILAEVSAGVQDIKKHLQNVYRASPKNQAAPNFPMGVKYNDVTAMENHFSEIQKLLQLQTRNTDASWRSIMNAIHQHHANAMEEMKIELKKLSTSLCHK